MVRNPASHKIAQDRTIKLFDCVLRINYWRNGPVELRPLPGWSHFCVTGDPRCQHPGRVARLAVPPHASSKDSVVLSTSADILILTAADYQSKPIFWPKRSHRGAPQSRGRPQGRMVDRAANWFKVGRIAERNRSEAPCANKERQAFTLSTSFASGVTRAFNHEDDPQ